MPHTASSSRKADCLEPGEDPNDWNTQHGNVRDLRAFSDAHRAVARISEIYGSGCQLLRRHFERFVAGERGLPKIDACYPYMGIDVVSSARRGRHRLSYGAVPAPGTYGTTLTQPRLFHSYYLEQIRLLLENHGGPVLVGISDRQIPLTFAFESLAAELEAEEVPRLADMFHLPELAEIDDRIANGTARSGNGLPRPLALFGAERVDFSLSRLRHYTGTAPGVLPAFRSVHELPALCRRVHRLRKGRGSERRDLPRLRRAGERDHLESAGRDPGPGRTRRRSGCRRCRPTIWSPNSTWGSLWSTSA